MSAPRIQNLNLFRAIAIAMVIYFHVTQMFLTNAHISPDWYQWGKYGVEFFFVLSGFLIGGLYYKSTVKINLAIFWLQRFLRTYPPYLVALFVSFISVKAIRHDSFDYSYLVFFQNWYKTMPFFLISWSLCVEEHFYLFFPLLLLFITKFITNKTWEGTTWLLIALLPSVLRVVYGNSTNDSFGFFKTATIFRYDGIALGCLLAFLVYRIRYDFSRITKFSIPVWIAFLSLLWINQKFSESGWVYNFGYFLLNLSLALLLTVFYVSKNFAIAGNKLVTLIASMAYSLYLTHALTIHVVVALATKFGLNNLVSTIIAYLLILAVAYLFYIAVERPSIKARTLILKRSIQASRKNSIVTSLCNFLQLASKKS